MNLIDYCDARKEIASGDVLLFEGAGFYSGLIRARTRSAITHCGIAWRAYGRLFVIEALVAPGVDVNPLGRVIERPGRVHWLRLDPTIDRGAVVSHALDQWGERYSSWRQIIRSFLAPAWLRTWFGLADDREADRWFCSELVLSSLYAGGFRPAHSRPASPATVAPVDLLLCECLELKGVLRV